MHALQRAAPSLHLALLALHFLLAPLPPLHRPRLLEP